MITYKRLIWSQIKKFLMLSVNMAIVIFNKNFVIQYILVSTVNYFEISNYFQN